MSSILGIDPDTKIVRMVGDDTKSERVFAANRGFDIVTVSDEIARLAYGEKWPLTQLLEHVDQGGEYAYTGKALPAGVARDNSNPAIEVYTDTTTNQLYYRTCEDFALRMRQKGSAAWAEIGIDYAAGQDISVEILAHRPVPAMEPKS